MGRIFEKVQVADAMATSSQMRKRRVRRYVVYGLQFKLEAGTAVRRAFLNLFIVRWSATDLPEAMVMADGRRDGVASLGRAWRSKFSKAELMAWAEVTNKTPESHSAGSHTPIFSGLAREVHADPCWAKDRHDREHDWTAWPSL